MEQIKGIKDFIRKAQENKGIEYDDNKTTEYIKSFNYDTDRIIDDISAWSGLKEDEFEGARKFVYEKYDVHKPDDENLAEIDYLNSSIPESDAGYDRYNQIIEQRNLGEQLISNLEKRKIEREQPQAVVVQSSVGAFPMSVSNEPVYEPGVEARIKDLRAKIDEYSNALDAQGAINEEKTGFRSQQVKETRSKYEEYDNLLSEAIKEREKNSISMQTPGAAATTAVSIPRFEDYQRVRDLRDIKDLYNKIGKVLEAPQGNEQKLGSFLYGLTQTNTARDFFTLGMNEMDRSVNVRNAFNRYQEQVNKFSQADGLSEEEVSQKAMENIGEYDRALLEVYQQLQQVQTANPANFWVTVGEGVQEMLPFIVQFAATNGTATAAKTLVRELVENRAKSAIVGKVAGGITKLATQAAIMPYTYQSAAERTAPTVGENGQLQSGEDVAPALLKSYLSTMAEVLGEDAATYASRGLRNISLKRLADDPTAAQKFLAKAGLAMSVETGVPTVQNVPFELLSEEVTGTLQAAIDQDGSFFTTESQKQLLATVLIASGGALSISPIQRYGAKKNYMKAQEYLNDIPNEEYAQGVQTIVEQATDSDVVMDALNELNKQYTGQITREDFLKARFYASSALKYNMISASRAMKVEQAILDRLDDNGTITTFEKDGQVYYVKNASDLADGNKPIFAKDSEGNIKPFAAGSIQNYQTYTQDQVKETISMEDQMIEDQLVQEDLIQEEVAAQEAAANPEVVDQWEQKMPDGSKISGRTMNTGMIEIETEEGVNEFETQEEADAFINETLQAKRDEILDTMPAEDAYNLIKQSDPAAAEVVLVNEINKMRQTAESMRTKPAEKRSEQLRNIDEAKALDEEANRLEQMLAADKITQSETKMRVGRVPTTEDTGTDTPVAEVTTEAEPVISEEGPAPNETQQDTTPVATTATVQISEMAAEDMRHKPRATQAIQSLADEYNIPVEIINSSEMSDRAKRAAAALGTEGLPPAFYDETENKIYVLSDRISSVADTKKSYVHEAVVHYGLRKLFANGKTELAGKNYAELSDLLQDVWSAMSVADRKRMADLYGLGKLFRGKKQISEGTIDEQLYLAEEYLAYISELSDKEMEQMTPFFERIARLIRKMFGFTSKQFDTQDVINILKDHKKKLRQLAEVEKSGVKPGATIKDATQSDLTNTSAQYNEEGGSRPVGNPTQIRFRAKEEGFKDVVVNPEGHNLSFVTQEDLIDIEALLKDISDKGQKVWFWVGDQLGRGNYYDSIIREQHYLDAGMSFPLDPANREEGAIWASGLDLKPMRNKMKQSDYIMIISGSATESKFFNRQVFNLLTRRAPDFTRFKAEILGTKPVKPIVEVLSKFNTWDELEYGAVQVGVKANGSPRMGPARKVLLSELYKASQKKTTNTRKLLDSKGYYIDPMELRDGFLADNGFDQNDIMIVLKPTEVAEGSNHSTYLNTVYGEVVGVPNKVVNAFDVMPEEYQVSSKGKPITNVAAKSAKIAPYGAGIRPIRFRAGEPTTINVDGVERSRVDSNGNAIHPTEQGIINFWRWFKDSAVVDENNLPVPVYHGTKGDFEAFKLSRAKNEGQGAAVNYFAVNPEYADNFAFAPSFQVGIHEYMFDVEEDMASPWTGSVVPVYVSLQNPLDVRDYGLDAFNVDDFDDVVNQHLGRRMDTQEFQMAKHVFGTKREDMFWERFRWNTRAALVLFERLGFDGVLQYEMIQHGYTMRNADRRPDAVTAVAIAIKPGQVKSAISNTGAFNGAKDAIRFRMKFVPDNVSRELSIDKDGNVLFVHYGNEQYDMLDPKEAIKNPSRISSSGELASKASAGGVVDLYTHPNQKEPGTGNVPHVLAIDPDKVYYLQGDPMNLYDEAKARFNEKYPDRAFGPNDQAAWIGKVANDYGFDVVVTDWSQGPIAKLTKAMEITGGEFGPRPNRVPSAGESVRVAGESYDVTYVDGEYVFMENEHTKRQIRRGMAERLINGFNETPTLDKLYKARLKGLKENRPNEYWTVDMPADWVIEDAFENGRLVDVNGGMGIVTSDGNLIGLFKYDPSAKGTAAAVQAARVALGGVKTDVYDINGLVENYSRNGFREIARVKFDENLAPEDMPASVKDQAPDVVFMVYDPKGAVIKADYFTYEQAVDRQNRFVKGENLKNQAADTQGFFSDVVTGKSDKFKPIRPWEPILPFNNDQFKFNYVMNKFKGNFDEHIATSIPAFRDVQVKVGSAIVKVFKEGGLMYDIGGSEGGFAKAVTQRSQGKIKSINLDPNPDMQAAHETTPVEGADFVAEAFHEGFEDDGVVYVAHNPTQKADVVHESMVFQFITPERSAYIKEIASKYLNEGGVFISEEKFKLNDVNQQKANEDKKNKDYKPKFYSQEQITEKAEEVLVGMHKNQAVYDNYIAELEKSFDYVGQYWDGGNFKGVIATNDKARFNDMMSEIGDTDTEFSERNIRFRVSEDAVREKNGGEMPMTIPAPLDIHRNPKGRNVTAVSSSYNEAFAGGNSNTNLWIRNSKEESNENRMVSIQFTPKTRTGSKFDKYFDTLYSNVPGYDRSVDFWEVPPWMARIAAINPNTDVYIVRNMKEADAFIKEAGYGNVLFSAMDVVMKDIETLVSMNPDQKFQVGTYAPFKAMSKYDNASTFNSVEKFAESNGFEVKHSYDYSSFRNTKTIPRIRTSEGCFFHCAFCSNKLPVKALPKAEIMQQVEDISKLDAKLVYIGDKAFGQAPNRQDVIDAYNGIKENNPNFDGFIVQTSALDFANRKVFTPEFIKDSGLKYIELGVETYNDDILTKLNKRHSHAKYVEEALANARENGVKIIPNIIVGLTGRNKDGSAWEETRETYQNTLNWLRDNRDVISHINIYSLAIYENTEIADDVEVKSEFDSNESIVQKSFHKDPKVHEWALNEFLDYGVEQITGQTTDKSVRFRVPQYISPSERSLVNIQDKGTVAQLKKQMLNNGAKQAELDWMGFDDRFPNVNKKITKQDIQDWIEENRIDIVEVNKGDDMDNLSDDFYYWVRKLEGDGYSFTMDKRLSVMTPDKKLLFSNDDVDNFAADSKYVDELKDLFDEYEEYGGAPYGETKYSEYVLRNGENYRELLLTMPSTMAVKFDVVDGNGKVLKSFTDRTEAGQFMLSKESENPTGTSKIIDVYGTADEQYKSGHWNEKNIVAHIRFNERTMRDGRKVLFIEEIQSDWAQEGKKEGFISKELTKKYAAYQADRKRWEALNDDYQQHMNSFKLSKEAVALQEAGYMFGTNYDGDGKSYLYHKGDGDFDLQGKVDVDKELTPEQKEMYDKLLVFHTKSNEIVAKKKEIESRHELRYSEYTGEESLSYTGEYSTGLVPDMPFKKTDQWVNLVLRRMIYQAADGGFDAIAWTTGKQQSDRYDLSQSVNSIVANNVSDQTKESKPDFYKHVEIDMRGERVELYVDKNGVVRSSDYEGKRLDDVVGVDIAKKIMAPDDNIVIKGEGLSIGGEGMKSFYDQIVPKLANKIGKKFGSKVGVINFKEGDGFRMWNAKTGEYLGDERGSYMLGDPEGNLTEVVPKNYSTPAEKAEAMGLTMDDVTVVYNGMKDEAEEQLAMPVTQKMKDSAKEGVVMFRVKDSTQDTEAKSLREKIEDARVKTNTDPSEAQIEAGNYSKGTVNIDGMEIAIENPAGDERNGHIQPTDYGYIKGTKSSDGEGLDVFIGKYPEISKVYVIDQVDPDTKEFDESKIMIGFDSVSSARKTYLAAYDEGWQGLGAITRTSKEDLKQWMKDGDTTQPFSKGVRFRIETDNPQTLALLEELDLIQKSSLQAKYMRELREEINASDVKYHTEIRKEIDDFKHGFRTGTEFTKEKIAKIQAAIITYAKKNVPLNEATQGELGQLLTLIKNASTPGSIERAFDRIDEMAKNAKIGKQKRKIDRIIRWATNYRKQGNKRVGKFTIQLVRLFDELGRVEKESSRLAAIKFSKSKKYTQEDKDMADARLEAMWQEIEDMEDKYWYDTVRQRIIEYRRLGKEASYDLVESIAEDLDLMYAQAKHIKNNEDAKRILDRREDINLVEEGLSGEALRGRSLWKKFTFGVGNFVANAMGNWETLMTVLGGTKLRDEMSLILNEVDMEIGIQATFDDLLNYGMQVYGFTGRKQMLNKIQELKKEEYRLVKPIRDKMRGKGEELWLSKMGLIDLYNATKQEDIAMDAYLTYGNIVTKNEKGDLDREAQAAIGKERIDKLLENLTEEDKAFGDKMQEIVQGYHPRMNKVFVRLFNRDMPKNKNYWMSTAEFKTDADVTNQYLLDSKHPSSVKERSGHRSVKVGDAFDKFSQHVKQAEWFVNMGLPMDRINKIFSDLNLRDQIKEQRGDLFLTTIAQTIKNLGVASQSRDLTHLERVGGNILGNWVSAKIGLTPSVPFKQLTSVINYTENMPPAEWLAGFTKGVALAPATFKEMWDNIPYLRTRFSKGYSEALQYAMNATGDLNQYRRYQKAKNIQQAMKDLATIGTRGGDIMAIIYGGKPYVDYLIRKGFSKEEAYRRFMLDTLRSQQSPFTSTLSLYQNSKNPFAKALFTFANTPSQYMRKLYEANASYRHGDISAYQAAKIYAIYAIANQFLYIGAGALMAGMLRGDDPREDLGKNTVVQIVTSLVGGLPLVKDLVNTIAKQATGATIYDSELPIIENILTTSDNFIKFLRDDDADAEKKTEYLIKGFEALLEMGGVPAMNAEKVINATFNRKDTYLKTRSRNVDEALSEIAKEKKVIDKEMEGYTSQRKKSRRKMIDYKVAEAAKELKAEYSKAKREAKDLEEKGKKAEAEQILYQVGESKMRLNETEYTYGDINMELKSFKRLMSK